MVTDHVLKSATEAHQGFDFDFQALVFCQYVVIWHKTKARAFFWKESNILLIKPTTCCLIVCSSTLEHVEAKSCSAGSLLMVLNLRESNRSTSDETNEQWIQNILSFKKLIPSCKVMTLFFSYMWTKLVVQKKRVSMSAKLTGLWLEAK